MNKTILTNGKEGIVIHLSTDEDASELKDYLIKVGGWRLLTGQKSDYVGVWQLRRGIIHKKDLIIAFRG